MADPVISEPGDAVPTRYDSWGPGIFFMHPTHAFSLCFCNYSRE